MSPSRRRVRQSNPFPFGMVLGVAGVLGVMLVIGLVVVISAQNEQERKNAEIAKRNEEIRKKREAEAKAKAAAEGNTGLPKAWHEVKLFDGAGNEETDPFEVKAKTWKIVYKLKEFDSEEGPMKFKVQLNKGAGDVVGEIISKNALGEGEYEHEGKGEFYLLIESSGLKWEIEIKAYR